MSRRYEIINNVSTHLASLVPVGALFTRLKYIDEVAEFPTICIFGIRELHERLSDRVQRKYLEVLVRAYVRGEDSVQLCDDILEEIETALNNITSSDMNSYGINELRVTQVSSDEGLFEPFGICDTTIMIETIE